MSIKEVANILINAKRPIDVFEGTNINDVKKRYKDFTKICHPDLAEESLKPLAEETTKLLNKFYEEALEELEKEIYNVVDPLELYKKKDILFNFEVRDKTYEFYEYLYSDDVCDIYEGLCDGEFVELKIVSEESDNELLEKEYNILSNLEHLSLPKPITMLKINDKVTVIYEKPKGLEISELKKNYVKVNGEHICWMLERLLSVVGYLHSNKIVHGNIKEENILIDPDNHNVILKDFTLSIANANESDSRYTIINDDYTPSYVDKNTKVMPSTDIYAVGKIAINLVGGDIKNVAMPINIDVRVRSFIRKLLDRSEVDAWRLWDELRSIRDEVYGTKRFQILRRKKDKGGI